MLEFLFQPFLHRTVWDIALQAADILIVGYLVYRMLLITKGTRSAALAVGFIIVWVAYVASPMVGLHTLHRLLETLFSEMSMFVIFALIVFQDEIRRAMAQVGRFRRPTPVIEAQAIEEVVQAAGALARKRMGAIIVFEGSANLDEYITEGTVVDAALTRESLFAAFIPSFENPLHDGATIIRRLRLYKAGALLPLSTRHDLAKSLGTRHRAAIGITEHTDAVTIVVSEERGVISSCIGGNIVQDLDMANLRKLLMSRFRREREKEGWSLSSWWKQRRRRQIADRKTVILDQAGAAVASASQPPGAGRSPSIAPQAPAGPSIPPPGPTPEKKGSPQDAKGDESDLGDSKDFAEFLGNKT